MFSALLVALREGVEAALVVGIVLVYLDRTGRHTLRRYVWAGVGLAAAASIVAAYFLQQWQVSEDGFEGVLMLIASALVVTMIIWMNHVARSLRSNIEQRIEQYAKKTTQAAGFAIGLFVFLMVVREGAELVLILRAVELSTAGMEVWIGTALGIALAVAVGVFFFQGTLRIPLNRFFSATSAILIVVAFQLALSGLHEMSEAMWLPSSKTEMATIGPIVRNEFFFFVVILGVAGLVVLREWFRGKKSPTENAALNPAEKRRRDWETRKQRAWSFAAAFLCFAVVLIFAADFVYARAAAAPPQAAIVAVQGNLVRIPIATLTDADVHFFSVNVNGSSLRFFIVHENNGEYKTALDACMICGRIGYREEGSNLICRNCGAAVYLPSIGETGGCNPIPVKSTVQAGEVVVNLSSFTDAASMIHH